MIAGMAEGARVSMQADNALISACERARCHNLASVNVYPCWPVAALNLATRSSGTGRRNLPSAADQADCSPLAARGCAGR